MNTSDTRVTREQAAELVGVSPRQISRWSAAGLLTVQYGERNAWRTPATYDPEEVRAAPEKWRAMMYAQRQQRREGGLSQT